MRCARWPFVQLPTKLLSDHDLGDPEKVTYAWLAFWGGRDRRAFPSQRRLAEERRVSVATIRRHVSKLETLGWIRRTSEGTRGRERVVIEVQIEASETGRALKNERTPPSPVIPPPITGERTPHHPCTPHLCERTSLKREENPPTPSLKNERTTGWSRVASALIEDYPHGWDEGGLKRIPTLDDVSSALQAYVGLVDPAEIVAGARRFADLSQGQARKYNADLLKWLRSRGWTRKLDVVSADERGEHDPEAANRRATERTRREAEARRRGPQPTTRRSRFLDARPPEPT